MECWEILLVGWMPPVGNLCLVQLVLNLLAVQQAAYTYRTLALTTLEIGTTFGPRPLLIHIGMHYYGYGFRQIQVAQRMVQMEHIRVLGGFGPVVGYLERPELKLSLN